jgi:hypothetical protein
MSEKNDRVFQLSLTEIAFLLVFLLMLLLGYMIFKLNQDLAGAQQQIATGAKLAAQQEALANAQAKLKAELQNARSPNPDEVITKLVSQAKLIQEQQALRAQVADLDAQVSALTEVKAVLAKTAKAEQDPVLQQEIQQALTMKQAVTKVMQPTSPQKAVTELVSATKLAKEITTRMQQQGQAITPGTEAQVAEKLVQAYQQMSHAAKTGLPQIQKENADLRGQVAFLKGKLDARGGRDYPPCWADEHTGKAEFIFDIMMSTDGLTVSPAWPKNRAADALAFPTTVQLISPKKHPLAEFIQLANPIFADSKSKNCRHYVVLRSNITDTTTFNRYRYNVENMFYKLER